MYSSLDIGKQKSIASELDRNPAEVSVSSITVVVLSHTICNVVLCELQILIINRHPTKVLK